MYRKIEDSFMKNAFAKISESDKGYIAGIIDGEETITIIKTNCYKDMLSSKYYINIGVENTSFIMIDFLKRMLGGTFTTLKRNSTKTYYFWGLSARQAYFFLLEIKDYLKTKRGQAIIALKLYERILNYKYKNNQNKGRIKMGEIELSKREELHKKMQLLNHRGEAICSKT